MFRLKVLRAWLIMIALCIVGQTKAMSADSAVFDGSSFQLVNLSGKGQFVSYIDLRDDGTGQLWRVDVREPRNRLPVVKWSAGYLNYQMSADGESFLILRTDGTGGSSLALIRVKANHGIEERVIRVDGRIAGFGAPSADTFQVLLQSQKLILREISLDFLSGRVVRTNVLGLAQDVAYDGDGHVAAVRNTAGDWQPAHDGDSRVGFSREHIDAPVIGAASDGGKLWFRTKDADGFIAIAEANLLTGKQVTVAQSEHANVDLVSRDPQTGRLDAYMVDHFPQRWKALSAATEKSLNFLRKTLNLEPTIAARSTNDRVWLVLTSSTSSPPTYYALLRFAGGGHIERLFVADHANGLSPAPPPLVTTVKSDDGTLVQALASPPSPIKCNVLHTNCPFIVKVHGGPHRRDGEAYDAETHWLQEQGYWVLRVNYRGSSGFGDAFAKASNRQWGSGAIADIYAGIQWLVKLQGVDASRGAAVGSSYGGFAAIALSTAFPGVVKCVESMNGGGDFEAFARYVPERRKDMAADLAEEIGDPTNPAQLANIRAQSPLTRILQSKSSYLIEYGAKDVTSAPEQSTGFVDALKTTALPFVAVNYVDMPHEFRSVDQRQFHYRLMRRYLELCFGNPERAESLEEPAHVVSSGQDQLLKELGLVP